MKAGEALYANISFKAGGKKTYTYLIPDDWKDQVLPGVRVRTSFRGQSKVGFVIDVTDRCEIDPKKVLPIEEVLDGRNPVATIDYERLLKILFWTLADEKEVAQIGDFLVCRINNANGEFQVFELDANEMAALEWPVELYVTYPKVPELEIGDLEEGFSGRLHESYL